jgi:hypothetical protein
MKEKMKRVVTITPKQSLGDKRSYWMTRTMQERLDALEALRDAYIRTLPEEQQKFQRVCTIVKRSRG